MHTEKTNHKNRRFAVVGIAVALIGIVIASMALIGQARKSAEARETNAALRAEVIDENGTEQANPDAASSGAEAASSPDPVFTGWFADYAIVPDRAVDFAALQAINPDIYAWITVPGTNVDYPVVHAAQKGDPLYLDYDFQRIKSVSGAIYSDGWNSNDLSDPLTLIYGHNMKDGSMFATIKRFQDASFFDAYPAFCIYYNDAMLVYEVFAAYKTDDTHLLAYNDFSNPDVFTQYVESLSMVRDLNAHFRDVALAPGDRIVTLVTCIDESDTARYFVQGVLRKNSA